MTTQQIHGTVRTNNLRQTTKIFQAKLKTAAWIDNTSNVHLNTIDTWVGSPRSTNHLPGIFLRISTPSASAYIRMTTTEYIELIEFLSAQLEPLTEAIKSAEFIVDILIEAEKQAFITLQNKTNEKT